jgi:predicted small secreted protein
MLMLALCIALSLAACNRDDGKGGGPMEKAGREADRAIGQAGKAVEDAGRNMQDAAKGKKQD